MDDQDHDDFWNVEEIMRGTNSVATGATGPDGLWVDPFNPCLPSPLSRTCPVAVPLTGEVWPPFWRDTAPPNALADLRTTTPTILASRRDFRATSWTTAADGSQDCRPPTRCWRPQ